ncbi:MAG TPA: MOSC domain-containing protein [Gemmatimonadota bacterium]|nr:MOSC domain-containing protein [Gemmatimonadota bacterium]
MDSVPRATFVTGQGMVGNANQGGRRQVTVISGVVWERMMAELGAELDPSARRANLLVSGLDLEESEDRILAVGGCRIRLGGETRPCERMDEAFPGLRGAMSPHWRGGAFGVVTEGGDIAVGDAAGWLA